jgi:hypothetical protein
MLMKTVIRSFPILLFLTTSILLLSCEKEKDNITLIGNWTISEMQYDIFFKEDDLVINFDNTVGDFGSVQFNEGQQGTLSFTPDLLNELSEENVPYTTTFSWSEGEGTITLESPEGTYLWNILERSPDSYRILWYLNEQVDTPVEGIEYTFRISRTD